MTTRARRLRVGLRVVGLGVLGIVALPLAYLLANDDARKAYPSPEFHAHVHVLASETTRVDPKRPLMPADSDFDGDGLADLERPAVGDFDGDGLADELTLEYFHMEPLFRRTTSGMLRIHSGADGTLLLSHAVDTPMNPVYWCGDRDGNGTDDVCVVDVRRRTVLGRCP